MKNTEMTEEKSQLLAAAKAKERHPKMPEKYEVFIGNELSVQAIWKVIYPTLPGEYAVAALLTNRAYSRGIPLCQLRGKSRGELIKLILIDS